MDYKVDKTSLAFSIIALELVIFNAHFYQKRILVIASQCVNKRSQDFRHYYDRHFGTEVL